MILTQDFRIFLGTHVFEFESHYNQSTIQPLEFFSFLFTAQMKEFIAKKKKSIIVHHEGNKEVWPHIWPGPSTNKASLLGLLYTPSNKSTSPNAHHYMPTPNLIKAREVLLFLSRNLFAKPHNSRPNSSTIVPLEPPIWVFFASYGHANSHY